MREASRVRLAAAVGAASLALLPFAAAAQVPPPARATPLAAATLKLADLVVTMGPGNPFPSSFTVRNAGNGDAGVSVLKVTATLLPLERLPAESCPPAFSSICDLRAQVTAAAFSGDRLRAACGDPFADVLEAIPALKAGESKTVSKDTSRFGNLSLRLSPPGPPPGTHIRQGVTTLVCAFDVVAQADASNQVSELRKDNNTATLRVYREIRLE